MDICVFFDVLKPSLIFLRKEFETLKRNKDKLFLRKWVFISYNKMSLR